MKRRIDIETWERRDHYRFYGQFEEPFFGVCAEVDCTGAYLRAKAQGQSFFLTYLHDALAAANAIEAFRRRIEEGEVWVYEQVNVSPTIAREGGRPFGFSYMAYHPDFETFAREAEAEIARVQAGEGLDLSASNSNTLHCTTLPWLRFTSFSHARSFRFPDCSPKLAFGKREERAGRHSMPVSLHLHHALADGADAGRFFELFQARLDS